MCKWFDDVFLKSLFDQTGANRDKWITAKQTAICIKYMHRNTAHIETASGTYKHDNYYYQWENRQVFLSYSKLNGCSTINFSLTPEEIEESNKAYKAEKLQQMKDRAKNRYTRHPERHIEYIKKLETKLNDYQEEIKESIEEIEKLKAGIIANIQNLITKASPIFESLHTIEEVEQAQKQLDKAYEGGRAAITNSIYTLTEEQKNDLYYTFDINFSAVYDLAKHAIFNIQNGIQ